MRLEAEPLDRERQHWLSVARELAVRVGSGNKLADLLGLARPYVHRMLSGKKPLSPKTIERLGKLLRNDTALIEPNEQA